MTANPERQASTITAVRQETAVMVTEAMDQLNAAVKDFVRNHENASDDLDKAQRQEIIDAAQNVLETIKRPDDRWLDMCKVSALYTAAQMFYEWGAFETIPVTESISYQELATRTETEETLLRRPGGVLVSQGILKQIGPDSVSHTPRSLDYRRDNPTSYALNIGWQNGIKPYAQYPEYFERYGRKEPQTINHVPTTFAHGKPDLGFYEMLEQDPKGLGDFLKGMAHVSSRMPISGIYDFSWLVEEVEKNPNSDRAVLVDVGGGKGQAIKAIREEFPGLPPHLCVLEDRPETLDAAKALNEPELAQVQKVAADFHREQPVKGAYTYWVRRCFHNYSDDVCENMLRIIADAMATDSRLLIQEDVLDNPPSQLASVLDFMMLGFGGKERTLEKWSALVGTAGLRISSVSRGEGPWKTLSVIEVIKNE